MNSSSSTDRIRSHWLSSSRWIFIVGALLLTYTGAIAQKGWEIGGGLGIANYFGDLNPHYDLTQIGPAAGLQVRYNFNTRTAIRAQASYGFLRGDDSKALNNYQRVRNLHFTSHTFDFSAVYEFNFLPLFHGTYTDVFSPYLSAGLSIFSFNPRAKYNGQWVRLAPLTTEGQNDAYFTVSGAYVFGGGIKYNISREWTWNFDVLIHKTWTDYLDDVSTVYPDKTLLQSRRGQIAVDLSDPSIPSEDYPEIGQAGYQRGSPKEKDAFSIFTIGITYYFGRIDCPTISEF